MDGTYQVGANEEDEEEDCLHEQLQEKRCHFYGHCIIAFDHS